MHLPSRSLRKIFGKAASISTAFVAPFILPSAAMAQDAGVLSGNALNMGSITFAAPMMLAGLVSLPALWWLMRSVPPKPVIHAFPAIKLLFNLKSEDQEPARMPVWQRLIRLAMVGAVITGLAQPVLNPNDPIKGDGALLMVIDNGWSSAHDWGARVKEMQILVERAKRDNRSVMIMPTAPQAGEKNIRLLGPMAAEEAVTVIQTIEPQAWSVDHKAAAGRINDIAAGQSVTTHWLGNGLQTEGSDDLGRSLLRRGSVTVTLDSGDHEPVLLSRIKSGNNDLAVKLHRLSTTQEKTYAVTAIDSAGHTVQQIDAVFERGETEVTVTFDMAPELRSGLSRITVAGQESAGSTVLLDEQWHVRPVGIIASDHGRVFDDTAYINQALTPYAEVTQGSVSTLLDKNLSVLVMTDSAQTSQEDRKRIEEWVKDGGTLLRFAGPRLAFEINDNLLPVALRQGERSMGGLGAVTTGTLLPFPKESPFNGIAIPGNITVNRSILAEPSHDLDAKTWARLQDGTPLVSADERGNGRIILVHTSADTLWSNIPLTGLFIDMARVAISKSRTIPGSAVSTGNDLPPLQILNGKGYMNNAKDGTLPLSSKMIDNGTISATTPPGLYGYATMKYAHNLSAGVKGLIPFRPVNTDIETNVYTVYQKKNDLSGSLLAAGFGLLIADLIILLGQQGHLPAAFRRKNMPTRVMKDKGRVLQ